MRPDQHVQESGSPDLRNCLVRIESADHAHEGEAGLVIGQVRCCENCIYDDLHIELADGSITRCYEPECSILERRQW